MKALKSFSLVMAIVSVGLVAVLGTRAEAQSPSMIVIGEVSQVEGNFIWPRIPKARTRSISWTKSYVITDQAGKELRLELRDDTKVLNRVNPGDKIEAKISFEGHTLSVTRLKP